MTRELDIKDYFPITYTKADPYEMLKEALHIEAIKMIRRGEIE